MSLIMAYISQESKIKFLKTNPKNHYKIMRMIYYCLVSHSPALLPSKPTFHPYTSKHPNPPQTAHIRSEANPLTYAPELRPSSMLFPLLP